MNYAQQFNADILRVRAFGDFHEYVSRQYKGLDNSDVLSDMLRAQWVFAVSALDRLLHEIWIEAASLTYQKVRPAKPKYYDRIKEVLKKATFIYHSEESNSSEFEQHIRGYLSTISLQNTSTIEEYFEALYHSDQQGRVDKWNIWGTISAVTGKSAADIVTSLKNIMERRNKIVHESDIPFNGKGRQDLSVEDVNFVVDLIDAIGQAFIKVFDKIEPDAA